MTCELTGVMDDTSKESIIRDASCCTSEAVSGQDERKARIDALWEQMNKRLPSKMPKYFQANRSSAGKRSPQRSKDNHGWMTLLGLTPKKEEQSADISVKEKIPPSEQNGTSEEAKKLAAAALAAVKNGAAFSSTAALGKVEVTEVRDFAGQEIEVKKLVDPNSREATEKAKCSAGPASAVDAVLEQIKKRQKLSVLDKTKKDWGEFKEDNKGVEEELETYKKSSNQYLDRISFLQRTDYREFERERDARLAMQAKRKPDM